MKVRPIEEHMREVGDQIDSIIIANTEEKLTTSEMLKRLEEIRFELDQVEALVRKDCLN